MEQKTFLEETIEIIHDNGYSATDVLWVGNGEKKDSWENFTKISNFYYDSGFGLEVIAMNFVVVGKDWWLERHEYDGSEWWEFKQLPIEPFINGLTQTDLLQNALSILRKISQKD